FQNVSQHLASGNRSDRDISCSRWMLLNHLHNIDQEMTICRRVRDGCNLAAYFVDRQDIVRLPNQCLACPLASTSTFTLSKQIMKFGTRRMVHAADNAQVIFVLDGSCHQAAQPQATVRFMHQLNRLSKVIEKEFRSRRVRTKFMVSPERFYQSLQLLQLPLL